MCSPELLVAKVHDASRFVLILAVCSTRQPSASGLRPLAWLQWPLAALLFLIVHCSLCIVHLSALLAAQCKSQRQSHGADRNCANAAPHGDIDFFLVIN